MLAYNQEQFIAQAIESVLAQQTDFNIELIIGEDNSTDGTRRICQKYAEKYPRKIKLLLNEINIGLGANYVKTYKECNGKYVAICDGDDYWTDPQKLQKQVDFLENNPNFKIVFTNNQNIFPDGKKEIRDVGNIPRESSFEELVSSNYIASVTAMFQRMHLSSKMVNLIRKLPYGDWPTYLWVTRGGGKIFFMNEVTAVYRKDFGTSTVLRQRKSKIGEINLYILEKLRYEPDFSERRDLLHQSIIKYRIGLMASYNKEKKFFKSFKYFRKVWCQTKSLSVIRTYLYSLKTTFYS